MFYCLLQCCFCFFLQQIATRADVKLCWDYIVPDRHHTMQDDIAVTVAIVNSYRTQTRNLITLFICLMRNRLVFFNYTRTLRQMELYIELRAKRTFLTFTSCDIICITYVYLSVLQLVYCLFAYIDACMLVC